jgi:hypothetical protein
LELEVIVSLSNPLHERYLILGPSHPVDKAQSCCSGLAVYLTEFVTSLAAVSRRLSYVTQVSVCSQGAFKEDDYHGRIYWPDCVLYDAKTDTDLDANVHEERPGQVL